MRYEISVSLVKTVYNSEGVAWRSPGMHLFTTALNTANTEEEAVELVRLFQRKFTESEGFKISVTRWASVGHQFEANEFLEEAEK